jgi:hypothetical protein
MKSPSVKAGYIPIDKTDTINKMLMDLFHGRGYDSIDFVKNSNPYALPADVKQAAVAIEDWGDRMPVRVGQSGKLLRSLKFYAWETGVRKKFVIEGTLKHRKICDDPKIVDYSQEKLLGLDDDTTQFASAKVLLGDEYRMKDPPFKLKQAYDSYREWNESREKGERWKTKPDSTIARQADAIMYYVKCGSTVSMPVQPEDYPLYRVFGNITAAEGDAMWGRRLRNHESDRIQETENTIKEVQRRDPISSRDHRVIVAGVVLQIRMRHKIEATYMEEVGKSWPQFPDFAKYVESGIKDRKKY